MGKSLGTIEVVGLSSAIVVADAMAKTANIEINDLEITKGFGFVTVKIFGDVGAVKAAISAGKSLALQSGAYVASNVIARPNMDLEKRILSFKEEKKEEPKKEEVKEEPKVEEKVENTSENTEKPVEKKEEVKDTKEEVKPEAKEDKKVENEQIKEEIKETKSQSSSNRRRKTTTNKVTNENNNSNK
ncbi:MULTISPECIES: BMC domain-containing protein [Peptostreptococcales]|uniref:BMC domain-containing protein n=1 Tax=Peptostreptococcales TaxID=3082720 RepID=UPI000E52A090|nr:MULTISPECIES: BMC domain-containing protein [Peptostreptococcaceae]MEE0248086.1 BMC domain-containing protein [Peptacetobacter hiranonis]RHQ98406.1 BMC domain-containing protein [Peptoclostridium sp. AF21-18]